MAQGLYTTGNTCMDSQDLQCDDHYLIHGHFSLLYATYSGEYNDVLPNRKGKEKRNNEGSWEQDCTPIIRLCRSYLQEPAIPSC